ncbi:unnamed protein product [Arctogadus glacialis]
MMGFELDDSLKTYNPGKESHRTVTWLKERPFRAAAVCLGVLCVVLLTGIIIVAGHHNHAAVEQPTPSCNLIGEQVQLGTRCNLTDLRREQTRNKNVTKERDQLRITCTNLIQEQDLLGTSNKYLTKEMNQLQTINNNLTQERDLLQTSNNNLSEEMYQLQTINNNLTQERDLLQTSNKNLTEAMYQLQTINNNVTLERDQLKELQRLSDGGGCLAGWQPHGASCYFLSAEKKSWNASRQDCQDKDADLVVIHSEEEQNFINNFCWSVWIGLHDMESESEWKWVDGSPMKLSLWHPGEPNNVGNEDCAELMPESKTWNDIPCSWERHWVCKSVKRN